MANEEQTGAAAIIGAMRDLHTPEVIDLDPAGVIGADQGVVALPRGMELKDLLPFLDARLPAPRRIRGVATHTTLESFIAHAKMFGDAPAAIFANDNRDAPKLVSVFDYHAPGKPRFGEHRGVYAFPLSDEWLAWQRASKSMSQVEFAQLIEDRLLDVASPDAAPPATSQLCISLGLTLATPTQLMALSRGLTVRAEHKATQAVTLSSGELQVAFEEKHTTVDGKPLTIPGAFLLALPVFRGGERYFVPARLRYRLNAGQVTWQVILHRADAVFDDAFTGACTKAAAETTLPVFRGTPEA